MQSERYKTESLTLVDRWATAWDEPVFKRKFLIGMSIFISLMPIFPVFYQYIEQRNGFPLQDAVLEALPAYDVSIAIFIVTWFTACLCITRAVQNPSIFITFMYGFIILNFARFISISLVPFNPPANLIAISDPISNLFYGERFVTKDLFFSGHTSTMFLIYLCLRKPTDKTLALTSTLLMAVFVLIQHVHFTVDVLFAPVFTYMCYVLAVQISSSGSPLEDEVDE